MATPVSFAARIHVAPEVLFRRLGDESVLLNLRTELYLGLDAVGTRMWSVLTESPSIDAAYTKLLQEFDVDADRLRKDLGDLVQRLSEELLIEIGPPNESGEAA